VSPRTKNTAAPRDLWRVTCPAFAHHAYEQYRDRADGAPPQKQCGGGCVAVVEKEIVQTHEQNLAWWAELNAVKAGLKDVKKKLKSNRSKEKGMTEKTDTKQKTTTPEIQGTRHPLAVVPSLPPANTTGYIAFQAVALTEERKAFIKKQFAPPGCSDVDLEYFFAFCGRTGLDPVLKQAYLVERGSMVNGSWVVRFEPMASIAGMTARADALPDFRGMLGGAVYEGDVIDIDFANQKVVHSSNPLKRGKLIGAWAHIQREGRRVIPTYFLISERIQLKKDGKPTKFWEKMTAGQLLKCCEAEQYRKGYGNIFGSTYVSEEMDPESNEMLAHESDDSAPADQRNTTDRLVDAARRAKSGDASRPQAESVPASRAVVEVVATKPSPTPPKPDAKAAADEKVTAEAKRLIDRCEALGLEYDGQKLLGDSAYREALAALVESTGKRAVGAVSGNTMDRADTAGPAPVEEKLPHQVAEEKKAQAVAMGPVMVFGTKRGQLIESLTGPELLENLALGVAKIGTLEPKKADKVSTCIDQIKTEQKKRDDALKDLSEPGSFEVD